MRRNTVVLEFRSPTKASGATVEADSIDGITGGLQFPSFTIQRAWHRIGERKWKAIQPAPNAHEDAAQTIGGRIPTAISPAGSPARPGRPRRTPQLRSAVVWLRHSTRNGTCAGEVQSPARNNGHSPAPLDSYCGLPVQTGASQATGLAGSAPGASPPPAVHTRTKKNWLAVSSIFGVQ
jgi:hypothetical protein